MIEVDKIFLQLVGLLQSLVRVQEVGGDSINTKALLIGVETIYSTFIAYLSLEEWYYGT